MLMAFAIREGSSPMLPRAAVSACLCAVLLVGCGSGGGRPAVDTAKIVDTIKSDEVHWNEDYKSGDAAKVAAHYAPDAVAMYPGMPATVGAAAIKAVNEKALADPKYALSFSSDRIDVAASGDLAAARGTYTETTTDPKTGAAETATGSYVAVYRPGTDGVWKAVWDIDTPGPASTP